VDIEYMKIKHRLITLKDLLHNFAFRDIRVLIAALILVSASWAFIEIADEVTDGSTQEFDEWVLKTLRNAEDYEIPRGPAWLPETVRDITALGGGTVIVLLTLSVAGFLILRKEYKILWLLLFAVIGGALVDTALKELFARERPNVVLQLMTVTSFSFPSGHSMMSMVVYLSLGSLIARLQTRRRIRVYIIALALFFSFIIGISRIYLGVHYPTDVIAGWSIGLAWATLVWFVAWYIQKRNDKTETNG
jgi:undecaprenyl-diphosphatase